MSKSLAPVERRQKHRSLTLDHEELRQVQADITSCLALLREGLQRRLSKHGPKRYTSVHHTLGIVTEEYYEAIVAAQANDEDAFRRELLDIGVAALWGALGPSRGGRPAARRRSRSR